MTLAIKDGFHLTAIVAGDESAVVEALQEREIYERTLRIPWPYTGEHFRAWFTTMNRQHTFAIRAPDAKLVGACGFNELVPGHKAKIGYWLTKPLWGRGIMTAAVAALTKHAFDEHHVVRVEADVFATNRGSARVLEKNGFVQEGLLRKYHHKDGGFIDARVFALIR